MIRLNSFIGIVTKILFRFFIYKPEDIARRLIEQLNDYKSFYNKVISIKKVRDFKEEDERIVNLCLSLFAD